MDATRILLVTDFALFRDGLRMVLESQQDLIISDEAAELDAAVRLAREKRPDLILLDLHLPRNTGVQVAEQILAEQPDAKIIALIGSPDRDTVSKVIEAGVRGYLMKDTHAAELIQAIRCVAAGGAVIDPKIAVQMLSDYRRLVKQSAGADHRFSARELEMLRYLAARAGQPRDRPEDVPLRADGEERPVRRLPTARRGQPHRGSRDWPPHRLNLPRTRPNVTPCASTPVPAKVSPSRKLEKDGSSSLLGNRL